jgi:putative ABC transport system permease protein
MNTIAQLPACPGATCGRAAGRGAQPAAADAGPGRHHPGAAGGHAARPAFERDLAGIDLVVGAKGSPLQLILAGVFHIDVPTGNIPLAEVQALQAHPHGGAGHPAEPGRQLPGLSHRGHHACLRGALRSHAGQGAPVAAPMEAVLGASVAGRKGGPEGRRVRAALWAATAWAAGACAWRHPYTVTGVLAPCGCVLDRLILTAPNRSGRCTKAATADTTRKTWKPWRPRSAK